MVVVTRQSKITKIKIWWDKGINNLADYHTKHFPPSHHQQIRPTYILKGNYALPMKLQLTQLGKTSVV